MIHDLEELDMMEPASLVSPPPSHHRASTRRASSEAHSEARTSAQSEVRASAWSSNRSLRAFSDAVVSAVAVAQSLSATSEPLEHESCDAPIMDSDLSPDATEHTAQPTAAPPSEYGASAANELVEHAPSPSSEVEGEALLWMGSCEWEDMSTTSA
jgi:hypothetical protein